MRGRRATRKRANPAAPRSPSSYDVGYGKPPVAAQFKPGKSGNPKGRPRGSRNLNAIIAEVLSAKIKIREGEKVRHVTRIEALARKQLEAGLKGDQKAIQTCFRIAKELGLMEQPESAPQEPWNLELLTDEELNFLLQITEKMSDKTDGG